MSLLLILRNMLLATIISPINFYRAVFNSTLKDISQRLWLRLEMRLSKLSSASHTKPKGSFNFYVLTKWPKFGPIASPPCLHLFDFGNPSFCELTFPPPPHPLQPPTYQTVKSCYFIDSWTNVIIYTYKCRKKIFPWYEWMFLVFS